jgi:hypothetical protein
MRQVAVKVVNACGAAVTPVNTMGDVAVEVRELSDSQTVISSNSKGGPVMVSLHVTCCGTASSVTFKIRQDALFNEQEGGIR